jgi:hypothetical protein
MQRQLAAFVNEPGRPTFLAARDAVLRRSAIPLSALDLADLARLLAEGQHEALLERIDALPPSKVLSPRVHYLAAEAADALRDFETSEIERSLFVLVLQGLLSTGSGTQQSPYVVCHASDEYDVLDALNLTPARQALVEVQGRLLDQVLCSDGREVWFDVHDLLSQPGRRAAKARPRRRRRVLPAGRARSARSPR